MSDPDEKTDPRGSAPPAPISGGEELRMLLANVLAEQLRAPIDMLHSMRAAIAHVTDHVQQIDRRLTVVEALRIYLPVLSLLVASVALVVALVALLRGSG